MTVKMEVNEYLMKTEGVVAEVSKAVISFGLMVISNVDV